MWLFARSDFMAENLTLHVVKCQTAHCLCRELWRGFVLWTSQAQSPCLFLAIPLLHSAGAK